MRLFSLALRAALGLILQKEKLIKETSTDILLSSAYMFKLERSSRNNGIRSISKDVLIYCYEGAIWEDTDKSVRVIVILNKITDMNNKHTLCNLVTKCQCEFIRSSMIKLMGYE